MATDNDAAGTPALSSPAAAAQPLGATTAVREDAHTTATVVPIAMANEENVGPNATGASSTSVPPLRLTASPDLAQFPKAVLAVPTTEEESSRTRAVIAELEQVAQTPAARAWASMTTAISAINLDGIGKLGVCVVATQLLAVLAYLGFGEFSRKDTTVGKDSCSVVLKCRRRDKPDGERSEKVGCPASVRVAAGFTFTQGICFTEGHNDACTQRPWEVRPCSSGGRTSRAPPLLRTSFPGRSLSSSPCAAAMLASPVRWR